MRTGTYRRGMWAAHNGGNLNLGCSSYIIGFFAVIISLFLFFMVPELLYMILAVIGVVVLIVLIFVFINAPRKLKPLVAISPIVLTLGVLLFVYIANSDEREYQNSATHLGKVQVFESWYNKKSGWYDTDYNGKDYSGDKNFEPIYYIEYLSVSKLASTDILDSDILGIIIYNKQEYQGFDEMSKVVNLIDLDKSYYFEKNRSTYGMRDTITLNLDKTKNYDLEIKSHTYTGKLEILDSWIKRRDGDTPVRERDISKDYSDNKNYARAFYVEYLSIAEKEKNEPNNAFLNKVIYKNKEYKGYDEISEIVDLINPDVSYYFERDFDTYYGDNNNGFSYVSLLTLNLDKIHNIS